jgi:hypothetical protein
MRYDVTVNKKYHYVKVFGVLKKINESTNPLSSAVASFVDRLIAKRSKAER